MRIAKFAAFLLGAALTPVWADTLTVGPASSGSDHIDIQDAVDAALPGDTILVAAGTYASFDVTKPVRILGAGRDQVFVESTSRSSTWLALRVRDVPAETEAVVSGMTLRATHATSLCAGGPSERYVAFVTGNDGRVVLHDVAIEPGPSAPGSEVSVTDALGVRDTTVTFLLESSVTAPSDACTHSNAVRAENGALWIANSELVGGGALGAGAGGHGILAVNADLHVVGSAVVGGSGSSVSGSCVGTGAANVGSDGGDAVRLEGAASLVAAAGAGAIFAGGDGSAGAQCHGRGGAGLRLLDTANAIVVDSLAVTGGTGFVDAAGVPIPLVEAPTEALGSSTLQTTPIAYLSQKLTAPIASPGSGFGLDFVGEPFHLGVVFVAFGSGPLRKAGSAEGFVALDAFGLFQFKLFLLDLAGIGSVSAGIPDDPSLAGVVLAFQTVQTNGTFTDLSNLSLLTLVP